MRLDASQIIGRSIEETEMSDLAGDPTAVAPTCIPSLLTVGGLLTWQTSESVCTGLWRTGSMLTVRARRRSTLGEHCTTRPRWLHRTEHP